MDITRVKRVADRLVAFDRARRRDEAVRDLRSSPDGAARAGLEGRIAVLDQRIMRLESDIGDSGTAAPVGTLAFPQEAMLGMIREAIDYASRWLRLCASKPAQGRTLASRDAEVLRDEILDRTDGVISELAAYSKSHDGVRTKAGIACH